MGRERERNREQERDRRRIPSAHEERNLVDVTPLKKPANPFRFGAAVMAQYRQAVKGPAAKVLEDRLGWLVHLSERIETSHTMPVLMMAITACATDGETRQWFRQVLDAIDDEVATKTGSRRRRRADAPEEDDELGDELDQLDDALDIEPLSSPPEGV